MKKTNSRQIDKNSSVQIRADAELKNKFKAETARRGQFMKTEIDNFIIEYLKKTNDD